jgi:hypothetical protein
MRGGKRRVFRAFAPPLAVRGWSRDSQPGDGSPSGTAVSVAVDALSERDVGDPGLRCALIAGRAVPASCRLIAPNQPAPCGDFLI